MNADEPGGGSRRPRPSLTDHDDDQHSASTPHSTQHVKGGRLNTVSAGKVEANVKSAGKNIHDRRDRHSTQKSGQSTNIINVNVSSIPYGAASSKSQGKRRHSGSIVSESESSQEAYQGGSDVDPLGLITEVVESPSRCRDDCRKRQRLDQKEIGDLKRHTEGLERKLRDTEAQLCDKVERLREAEERLSEQDETIQNQAQKIFEYQRVQRYAQVVQEAKDKIYELDRKDNEVERLLREKENTIKKLWRDRQNLRIAAESARKDRTEQLVICLRGKITKTQEKKRNASINVAASQQLLGHGSNTKEVIQAARVRMKQEREHEQDLAMEEERFKADLEHAEVKLSRIDEELSKLRVQIPPASYRPSRERPVAPSHRSDSGYGTATLSSASVTSPARSNCSVYSSADDPYDTRSLRSSGGRESALGRTGRQSLDYGSAIMESPPSRNSALTHSLPSMLPPAPSPPPAEEASETASMRARIQRSHQSRR